MLRTATEHYRRSALTARSAAREARRVRTRGTLAVGTVVAKYQVAQAQLANRAVAAMLDEQSLDAAADALLNSAAFTTSVRMLEAMLDEAGDVGFDRLVESLVQDAGRAAEEVAVAVREDIGHVRYLDPPSCSRCVVLAGRVYRYSTGFLRHPGCDCVMIPTTLANRDLVQDPVDLARRGLVTGLSKADRRAILEYDADFNQVVNIRAKSAGLKESGRVLARNGKMTPEGIFRAAGDDRDALVDLLADNGYVDPSSRRRTPVPSAGGASGGGPPQPPRPPQPPTPASVPEPEPGPGDPDYVRYWKARQDALEGERFTAAGEALEDDEVRFAERMVTGLGQRISWIPTGSNGSDKIGTLPANDFVWHTSTEFDPSLPVDLLVEHKGLRATTPVDAKHIARQIAKATAKNKRRPTVANVVVDVGDRDVAPEALVALRDYNRTAGRTIERLWVMSHGRLIWIPLN
ncbi:hypothetical protein [Pimelobacter simplex]|uniref:hypothetical protein n=1 Tax=Nocardioides simplex TaxID=2045 RepID=UPI003AAFF9A9